MHVWMDEMKVFILRFRSGFENLEGERRGRGSCKVLSVRAIGSAL